MQQQINVLHMIIVPPSWRELWILTHHGAYQQTQPAYRLPPTSLMLTARWWSERGWRLPWYLAGISLTLCSCVFFNSTLTSLTLSHGFDGDDVTGISTTRSGDSHHPDTVLSVPAQVGDAVEKHIRGRLKLTAHLGGETCMSDHHW